MGEESLDELKKKIIDFLAKEGKSKQESRERPWSGQAPGG
jgi:hypothetical protein